MLAWVFAVGVASSFFLYAHSQNLRASMLGAYICGAALVAWNVYPIPSGRSVKMLFAVSTAVLLTAVVIASASMSPSLTGPFLVGRFGPEWRLLAPKTPPHRAPAVELWYPVGAEVSHPSKSAKALAAVRQFFLTGETGLPDEALSAAPLAKEGRPFPLLLYFSGGAGEGIDNVYLISELVSHGFVVAAVHYPLVLPGISLEDLERRKADLSAPLLDFSSEDGFNMTVTRLNERARERAEDASSVLSALVALDAAGLSDALGRNLDTSRVGIFGFSFGGAVAAEAKYHDERFAAALNLDGWHFGEAVKHGVQSPYFLIVDDEPSMGHYEEILNQRELQPIGAMERHGGYLLTILGAHHMNFADRAFHSFLLRRMPLGPIAPSRAFRIISSYTLAFFETYLQDRTSRLLDPTTQFFSEADLKIWNKKEEAYAETP